MQPNLSSLVVDVPVKRAEVTCLAKVQPQSIEWLWQGRIALGKLSLISGDPGLGKSLLTLEMASIVSQGGKWPDGSPCPQGDVLMLSAEDAADDTIRPRLDACRGDPKRVHVLTVVSEPIDRSNETQMRGFSIKSDLDELERILKGNRQIKLVVIDPISSYLGKTDSHNNSDVRALLSPLADLAARYKVAVLAVTHLNKGEGKAIYRSAGSIAFTAAARAAYVVFKDNDNPERRLFVPVKNNLGDDRTGFAYSVVTADNGAPHIQWEPNPVTIDDVDDAVSSSPHEDNSALAEAKAFLHDLLSEGPRAANDVLIMAKKAGHSDGTVRRAKRKLGIKSVKQAVSKNWVWRLSDQDNQVPLPANVDHLDHLGDVPPEEVI